MAGKKKPERVRRHRLLHVLAGTLEHEALEPTKTQASWHKGLGPLEKRVRYARRLLFIHGLLSASESKKVEARTNKWAEWHPGKGSQP